jgi:hypothetical protein
MALFIIIYNTSKSKDIVIDMEISRDIQTYAGGRWIKLIIESITSFDNN